MKNRLNSNQIFLSISFLVYGILTIICWNNGYFGDNIQLTSIEAHWYYLTDFKTFLIPKSAPEFGIYGTGAPPTLPLITAFLWKFIGYKIWVSHAFIALWAIVLIFNLQKLLNRFFSASNKGWVSFIILMETSVLTQFAIAAPDFILFTALIISLRGIFEKNSYLLFIGFLFLMTISTRGFFTGCILVFVHFIFYFIEKNEFATRSILKTFLPYLPTFLLMAIYIYYYIATQGWFFSNSKFSEAQKAPNSIIFILKHLCDLCLRLIENGRILIWIISFYVIWKTYKKNLKISALYKFISIFFLLLTTLYLSFVFLTKMPFLTRYFMPHIFLLTLFTVDGLTKLVNKNKVKYFFILILCFELTGHFWIYPEKITKIWDSTLAHLPYYSLRDKCFNYIDQQKIDYKDISAGFCLYDNRQFVELKKSKKIVGKNNENKYFIYSNISNVPDDWIDEFNNKNLWKPIKSFKQGFVFITIYENLKYKKHDSNKI